MTGWGFTRSSAQSLIASFLSDSGLFYGAVTRLALPDQADIGFRNGVVYLVPAKLVRAFFTRRAVRLTNENILTIKLQHIGKIPDGTGRDQPSGLLVPDQALASGCLGRDNWQAASHGFQCHIAKSFGNRRVKQHIHAGHRAAQTMTLLEPGKYRVVQTVFKPLL